MTLSFVQFIIYIVSIPVFLSVAMVYMTVLFSTKYKLYDSTGGRKIHSGQIPRLGGAGFISAFIIGLIILHIRFPEFELVRSNFIFVVVASIIVFFMGLFDDLKNWKAIFKLLVQCIASTIVVLAGYKFTKISFAPIGFFWEFGWFAYPITFLWIIGVTNAVNLMDGIDGQAGSLSVSLLISYAVIFALSGIQNLIIYIPLILVSTVVGFLFFNLSSPSAKIFMGDGGSQFLGFIISVFPLMQEPSGRETIGIPFATIFLMLPIFDTIAAIWRRRRDRQPIGIGDKFHIHHKLMLIGFSSRGSLMIFMILQFIINIFVTMAVILEGVMALVTLVGLILVGILFFFLIHYEKQRIIKQ